MKKSLLAGMSFAALVATAAVAADVPPSRYIPPPRAPAYVPFFSWNGFYVGINAGYGWGRSQWTNAGTGASTGSFNADGALVGGTAGYNLQMGSFVFGAETDIGWSGMKGTSTAAICGTQCETSNQWLGTLRGRLGYAMDRVMPYATVGLAYGGLEGSRAAATPGFSTTVIGWTAGGGLEYAFASGNWSAKLEYLYVDFGSATCDAVCSGTTAFDVDFHSHALRAGLNYKF